MESCELDSVGVLPHGPLPGLVLGVLCQGKLFWSASHICIGKTCIGVNLLGLHHPCATNLDVLSRARHQLQSCAQSGVALQSDAHKAMNSSAIADAALDLAEFAIKYLLNEALQIFVISSQKIRQKDYETLYKYTTRNPKAAVSRYVSSVPLQWQVSVSAVPTISSFC